jgi:DNA-directed RNA polymerase subunit L
MELKTIKKTKTELEIEIIDENETLLNPITHILSENEDVEYAACMADNPLANKRRLFIQMKKGSPDDALKKAVKYLDDEIKKFGKAFETSKSKK